MKRQLCTILVTALCWTSAQAGIYTWVDAQGVRHYSDAPVKGAKPADLPGIQDADGQADALARLQKMAGQDNASDSSAEASALPAAAPAGDARDTAIITPKSGETIRNGQHQVPVSVTVGGAASLQPGEQLTYYFDGSPVPGSPTALTQITLGQVPRGTHTLSVALLYQGSEIKRTTPLTFYMMPPTAISPLNSSQAAGADSGVPGAEVAPRAGNAAGAIAAPRVHGSSISAGAAPRS